MAADLGQLQDNFDNGRITQAQYDAGLAAINADKANSAAYPNDPTAQDPNDPDKNQNGTESLYHKQNSLNDDGIDIRQNWVDPSMDPENGSLNAADAAQRQNVAGQLANVEAGRAAPQVKAAQQANAVTYGGAKIAANERSAGATLGPAAQGTATMGSATMGTNADINRQDEQFRNAQVGLASQLQAQANGQGPSLAQGQLKQATDRNIQQQMAVAAAQGGNPALAQRNAALGAAAANRGAASDSAQLRAQEQLAAQQQLAGVLNGARGQDIGVNTDQAGLVQQSLMANQAASNTQGLANQAASNQYGLANQDALNQFAIQQGQLTQNNQQFNAAATNATNATQAGFTQDAGMTNAAAQNAINFQNAQLEQNANIANQSAALQARGMDDTQIMNLLGLTQDQLDTARNASIDFEKTKINKNLGQASVDASVDASKRQANTALIGAGINAGATLVSGAASLSDPAAKVDIVPLTAPAGPSASTASVPIVPYDAEGRSALGLAAEAKENKETDARAGLAKKVGEQFASLGQGDATLKEPQWRFDTGGSPVQAPAAPARVFDTHVTAFAPKRKKY